jgi:cytoskeletal protein RodZ
MATGYNVTLRNAQMDAITTFAGAGAKLRIYDGARPATGGTATNLLAEFTLGSPFAPAASAAVLSPTLPANTTGAAVGTATWFRVTKADGTTHVIDGSAGTAGTDMILNTASITVGVTVAVTAWTATRGNA